MSLDASSMLTAFRRRSTADDVADALRAAIATGELTQGAPLREAALATRLGVGRASVREALRALIAEGLVVYEVHRAASVKLLGAEDAYDIYVLREAIEPTAVGIILETPSIDTSPLRDALDEIRRARSHADPSQELVEADVRFHETLVRLSGRPRLQRVFRSLMTEWRMYLLEARPQDDPDRYVTDHEELVEAVVSRRPDAPCVMRRHLRASANLIVAKLEDGEGEPVAVAERPHPP